MSDMTHAEQSRFARLTFEQRAMAVIIAVLSLVLLACFVALWPSPWAKEIGERITAMRDNIVYFVGLIAANLGITMTRGHMDARLNKDGDH